MPFVKDDPLIVQLKKKRKEKLKVKYPWRGDVRRQKQVADTRRNAKTSVATVVSAITQSVKTIYGD
mgnify:CR=1 FL=1